MNDTNTNDTPENTPITYGSAVIDTPEYDALHAAAVAAGVITAELRPARIVLANGRWQVTH